MTLEQFVAGRMPMWTEFEAMMKRSRRGRLSRLSTTEMERFATLYRHAASDLALARRDFPGDNIAHYLNGLCTRAHPLLVRGEPIRPTALPGFYARTVPRMFRATWRSNLLSLGIFLGGAVAGYLAVMLRPDLRSQLVPSSLFDSLAKGDIAGIPNPAAGSIGIIFNNIIVSLVCVTGGLLLGLFTAYALWSNGWILGTIGAAVHIAGYDMAFWSHIVPHGIVEISIILLAGGAGLRIADKVFRPRGKPRMEVVTQAAVINFKYMLAVVTLLIVCGFIEGFVSPSTLPEATRIAIGVIYATLFYTWLLAGGRSSRGRPAAPGQT